ncbi:hypothetical protein Tco_1241756, partial [Tanacetum coccineum]
ERDDREKDSSVNSTNKVNVISTNEVNVVGRKASIELPDEPNMHALEDIVYLDDDEDVGAEADGVLSVPSQDGVSRLLKFLLLVEEATAGED